MDPFMLRALLAGLGVACAAAPIGCFVVWRRMAYFGDATAHAAMLGVALALATEVPVFAGVLLVTVAMAAGVASLGGRGQTMDALLGVAAHGALAIGMVAVSLMADVRVDLMSFLFGDILAVSFGDVLLIWVAALGIMALMIWRWSALLTATLATDLAVASGISPKRERVILTLSLAVLVAVAIKVVGVLLIASMLIIPAAAARPLSRTPEAMAWKAAGIGCVAVCAGLWASFIWDTPTGPTIVSVAAAIFCITALSRPVFRLDRGA